MKRIVTILLLCIALFTTQTTLAQAPVDSPEQAITGLLNRIGGNGAAGMFEIVIDASLAENGKDVFVITSQNGKPCIKGNTQLSVATGINWYLNHHAHINLTWNNLTTDLSKVELPVPNGEDKHVCNTTYRYDFNTCTFSYSMAFWTWERWQQEIDWMALHGINAPLNLVGLDVVTRKFLRELGVSEADINAYIAGPGFIAWFAMNNLEGWGGTINAADVAMNGNPDWWYTRQENLCRNMLQRMRELGMQPVIPGFSGQVPNCIVNYSINGFSSGDVVNNGTWAGGYTRPDILKPNTESYRTFAAVYYKHLHEVMGVSELYSMDPFHEGSLPSGVSNETCYPNIMVELDKNFGNVEQSVKDTYKVTKSPSWIIQYWQGVPQSGAFTAMKNAGYTNRFIGLDLFADNIYADNAAKWRTNYYDTCPYIYCMLHNFGGRSGLHGRLETTMDGYFQALAKGNNCQGIGATPEGIETNPILYDMLFELPWMSSNPGADAWLEDYAHARYGVSNETAPNALEALKNLKKSVWECKSNQQGTSEAVILARPNWTIGSVSSWSTSAIYWDTQDVLLAADQLYSIKDLVTANGGEDGVANYNYDFIDVVRQAMVDYAAQLLPLINAARGNNAEYTRLYQLYLQLMLDLDEMLSYDENFKLERWTSLARNIANEVSGTTENDRNWLEWNARTQITVWSNGDTDLHDYSNRCWAGLIKDFHYKRWKQFFENNGNAFSGGWYSGFEYPWTVNFTDYNYSTVTIPDDMTATEKAAETFGKYFGRVIGKEKNYIFPMGVTSNGTKEGVIPEVYRGTTVALPLTIGKEDATITDVKIDLNGDGSFGNGETLATDMNVEIPAEAKIGKTTAKVTFSDNTIITFDLAIVEDITDERTVTAAAADNGTVAIEGTNELTITNAEAVTITATANTGYNFSHWTNGAGETVSNENPYIYYGKDDATFTANFIQDKWGVVACNGTFSGDIAGYKQFIHNLTFAYYNREAQTILETTTAPTEIFNTVPQIINISRGASFDVEYNDGDGDGLKYCYFRAYIDLNADGDFNDEGELLTTVGTEGGTNNNVCSNKINVLLPYDAPLGITHMRLRFDGAYDNSSKPSARGAKDASIRPVYEIILNITEGSDKAAHIKVESNHDAWGTVECWTDETPGWTASTEWDVSANIPMHIKAIPASDDTEFLGWYDQYGRLLTTDLEHSRLAIEDATYTAKFRRLLDIQGWQLQYRTIPATGTYNAKARTVSNENIVLTKVVESGENDLVIPETVTILDEEYTIVGFDNGLFNNNKELWSITLPKTIQFLSAQELFNHTLTGNGETQIFDVDIKNNEPWEIAMEVERTGELTGWGACLIASGENPAKPDGSNYAEGFQFYLQCTANGAARDRLIIKTKTQVDDNWYFDDIYQETKFTVHIEYNGAQQLSINVIKADGTNATNHNGKQEAIVFTDCTIQDITKLCTNVQAAITAKVDITKTKEEDPFSGCSNLDAISIDGECEKYYVSETDGKLYARTSDTPISEPAGEEKGEARRELATLIEDMEELTAVVATYNIGGNKEELTLTTTSGEKYYIYSNASIPEGELGDLLDNDNNSYIHTTWSENSNDNLHHYLRVYLGENPAELSNFSFSYVTRNNTSNHEKPKQITVSGCATIDGEYETIAVLTDLPKPSLETYNSPAYEVKDYKYLRFMVDDTYRDLGNSGHKAYSMAEFDLYKAIATATVVNAFEGNEELTNEFAAEKYNVLLDAKAVYNYGTTKAQMEAALSALRTAYDELLPLVTTRKEFAELIEQMETLTAKVATYELTENTELLPLTTEEGKMYYVSTNADQNTGGGSNDGGGIAALVDNSEGTYFHTRWGGDVVSEPHYIQVNLGAEGSQSFKFSYKPRSGSPAPSKITVQGSYNGTDFTDIVKFESGLPAHNSGITYESAPIDGKLYQYLRFVVTESAGPGNAQYGGQYFFGMLEFDLYKITKTATAEVAEEFEGTNISNEFAAGMYDALLDAKAVYNYGTATKAIEAEQALQAAYDDLLARINATRELATLIEQMEELAAKVATYNPTGKDTEIKLSTDENAPYYISCSNPHPDGDDGRGGVAALLDNNPDTYLHTNWTSGQISATNDYLQIDLGTDNELFTLKFGEVSRKDVSNDYPKTVEVLGSNDKEQWVTITTIDGLPQSGGQTWTSDVISPNAMYRYLRFVVTTGTNRIYFHMAEFDLYKVTSTATVFKVFEGTELNNDFAAAKYDVLLNAQAMYKYAKTTEQVTAAKEALQTAYNELEAKMKEVLPFELTFDESNPKLYKIFIKRTADVTVLKYDESSKMVAVQDKADNKSYQAWYFMNSDNGFTILPYNGDGKVLSADNTSDDPAKVWAAEKGEKSYYEWKLVSRADGYYNIQVHDGSNYFSNNGGTGNKMGFWHDDPSGDTGSLFKFVDATFGNDNPRYYQLKDLKDVMPADIYGGTTVGLYTGGTEYRNAYNAATTLETAGNTSDGNECHDAYIALRATKENLSLNVADPAKFYVIKSTASDDYCAGKYLHTNKESRTIDNWAWGPRSFDHRNLHFAEYLDEEPEPLAIFQFETTNTEGSYKMKNLHTGMYVKSFGKNAEHMGDANSAEKVKISGVADGQVKLQIGNSDPMHAQNDYSVIVQWGASANNASTWTIDEIDVKDIFHTLTITDARYSTLYLNYPVTIPAGVKAYVAEGIEDEYIDMQEITGGVIPANTATIINGEPGNYTFYYSTVAGVSEGEGEGESEELGIELAGTLWDEFITPGDNTCYVLSKLNGEVGLYQTALNYNEGTAVTESVTGTQFKNKANKVYLKTAANGPQYSAFLSFNFNDGITTDIKDIEKINETPAIYDLQGRKINEITQPGIYIVNGKKVLVK